MTIDLRRAINYLHAEKFGRGQWLYYEIPGKSGYVVYSKDIQNLGRALRYHKPDAYGTWFSQMYAERIPLCITFLKHKKI